MPERGGQITTKLVVERIEQAVGLEIPAGGIQVTADDVVISNAPGSPVPVEHQGDVGIDDATAIRVQETGTPTVNINDTTPVKVNNTKDLDWQIVQADYVDRLLDVNGVGTGNSNGANDYSSTDGWFYLADSTGYYHIIRSLMIILVGGNGVPNANEFGDITRLSQGLRVEVANSSDVLQRRMSHPYLKDNTDFFTNGAKVDFMGDTSNPVMVAAKFDFAADNAPLYIEEGNRFGVRVKDDLSGLSEVRFRIAGYRVSTT